jgi:hypothetical protein
MNRHELINDLCERQLDRDTQDLKVALSAFGLRAIDVICSNDIQYHYDRVYTRFDAYADEELLACQKLF